MYRACRSLSGARGEQKELVGVRDQVDLVDRLVAKKGGRG